ncbi:MAG: ABC transporter ATP-binding protein, partial [Verrucomicrobia bacterium]|nr:ABC transporter ATP-binding protein [Verrucomicrobiota bacterium]NDD40932.1 ABC transporter ATP-binding protein [Verrucomicrobiota bacterium]
LHQGRIYATGSPQELMAATDPVISRFVRGISDEKVHTF